MKEYALTVGRTARYYTFGRTPDSTELWVCCHGYGQLAAPFASDLAPLDDGQRLVVVPEALSRFYVDDAGGEHGSGSPVGASWMTRDARAAEIGDYVAYLDTLSGHVLAGLTQPPRAICVLGYSQGAATASRWAALGRANVGRLVLWGGMLPPDLDLGAAGARLRSAGLTLVAGNRDGYANPGRLDEQVALLARHDIPCRRIRFDGGHRLDSTVLRMLADDPAP